MTAWNGHRELWLVRHGETLANRGRSLAGWADVPLTEHGEAQAAALRPVLEGERFDGVWCSDLCRAAGTARLAFAAAARPDPRLREMSFGALEGVHWEALEERWQQALVRFEGFEPPGGETFEDLRARVLAFVDSLPPGRHLLFTHGGVVRLLSREVGEDQFVSNATVLVIDWEARRLVSRRDGEGEAGRGLPGSSAAAAVSLARPLGQEEA
jgi:probable phosphoglycerate mutase